MIQEKHNAENRILIDCPGCGNKDIDILHKEERDGRTELDIRCNGCRGLYAVSITTLDYSKIYDEEELQELQKHKGAKA